MPVTAVFLLQQPATSGRSADIRIDTICGAEAIMALIKSAFMLEAGDMKAVARQFATAGRIATRSPAVYTLAYPHDFGRLAAVRAAISSAVAAPVAQSRSLRA
jgi:hypothetical protein